ncbi:Yip1 family protein [Larsenimonas suaedae]|uniref:Yip1 family protein n=1 Tax=Larsenimonas suaedae TaxID=1851019 RepID=A0ABU1GTX2_9GAMM|nr:Yip1 family protein [Larsenimonas suaedae]MCM2972178.1 YIP1 family protein [Larsenimonas suaedae]MDR5895026.1 Yip1 family protein [Larsenimonas suaedae]
MIHHVWGLLAHPNREWRQIEHEGESVVELYAHHVLLLALVPVVCAFIGTTTFGWHFGEGRYVPLEFTTALTLAIVFYLAILGAVALVGTVLHWSARRFPSRPSRNRCITFAGYVGTPMFLSGIVALYPLVWLCSLAIVVGLCYTAYLLYVGLPAFFNITRKESMLVFSTTMAIGVLVLEALLAITVVLWGYGAMIVG